MHRLLSLLTLSLLMFGLGAVAPHASAQDGTPTSLAGHPLIGTWILADPTSSPSVIAFTSDGVVTVVDFTGISGLGSWESADGQGAAFTLILVIASAEFAATIQINGTVAVDAAADRGSIDFSYTVVLADGTVVDTATGTATIARLPIQPLDAAGTPMPGIPTWDPNQDEGAATPEASPSA